MSCRFILAKQVKFGFLIINPMHVKLPIQSFDCRNFNSTSLIIAKTQVCLNLLISWRLIRQIWVFYDCITFSMCSQNHFELVLVTLQSFELQACKFFIGPRYKVHCVLAPWLKSLCINWKNVLF